MATNETILVTGASGFLARYVIDALAHHAFDIVGMAQTTPAKDVLAKLSSCYQVDICDEAAMRELIQSIKPNYVIHLAGISFVGHSDPLAFYKNHVLGTESLLKALTLLPQNQVKQVYLASSATVYGANAKGRITEEIPPLPQNHYAQSKYAMELMAYNYLSSFSITALRLFNFTGVGQSEEFLVAKLVKHYAQRTPVIELGNTYVSRDFSDVRDTAMVVAKLLVVDRVEDDNANTMNIYNIASSHATSLDSLLATLSELTGHHPDIQVSEKLTRINETVTLWGDSCKVTEKIDSMNRHSLEQTLQWMLSN